MTTFSSVNRPSNRFSAQRPSSSNTGSPFNRNNNNQGGSPFGSRPGGGRTPFGSRNNTLNLSNVIMPTESAMVRFSLDGMGDPFYRLLGHEMNPDFGSINKLAEALRKGGEDVDELIAKLDEAWENYKLEGAMLVYTEDSEMLNAIKRPTPMPTVQQKPPRRPLRSRKNNNDDEEEEQEEKQPDWYETNKYKVERLRSIDLTLTLNVLARARTQVIVARAPVVFGVEYLTRSIITDDPRLVSLARATGSLPDA